MPTDVAAQEIALAWNVDERGGNTIIWHGGATGGFFAYLGLDPLHKTAAVVLSNSRAKNIDDIGLHLLDPTQPLLPPPALRTEASLSPAVLARYVGDYDLLGGTATITQAADGLTVHLPGEEPDRLYAESPTVFFFKDFDGHVNFQLDADGDVTSGTFHDQDGQMASITRHRDPDHARLTRSSIATSAPTTSTAPTRPSPGPTKDSPPPSPTGPSSCTPRQRRGSSSRKSTPKSCSRSTATDIRRGRSSTRTVKTRSRSRSNAEPAATIRASTGARRMGRRTPNAPAAHSTDWATCRRSARCWRP